MEATLTEALEGLPHHLPAEATLSSPIALPQVVALFLNEIALHGLGQQSPLQTGSDWLLLRNAIAWKIKMCLYETRQKLGFLGPAGDTFEGRSSLVMGLLFQQDEAPFTLQRICEILCREETAPKATHKILNSLERVLSCRC